MQLSAMFANFEIACVYHEGDDDDDSTEIRNKREAEQCKYTPTKTICCCLWLIIASTGKWEATILRQPLIT
jgi:hypothetical protein